MKVAFFAPTRRECGIADYSRYLLEPLRARVEVEVFAAERVTAATGYHALGRSMSDAHVAHIQYEHGFFLANDAPGENFEAFVREIRIPKVVTLHCLPLEHRAWQRLLQDPSVSFVVHSRYHLDVLRARGARGTIDATPHPAPPQTRSGTSADSYRSAHGLDGKIVLAILGFTKPHKGYDVALDALDRLPGESMLLVAGGPQDERDAGALSALLQRAGERGLASRLVVTGYIPEAEIGAVLGASDVVLAPFTSMTASASVATALAWQRPVVASALAQNVELREAFGCLQLFEPSDAEDLARQIRRVLCDSTLRRSLTDGARRFRERCTYDALAARTCSIYGHALGRSLAALRGC